MEPHLVELRTAQPTTEIGDRNDRKASPPYAIAGERAGGTPALQGLVLRFLSAGDSFCQNTVRRIERVTCLRQIGNS